VIPFLSSFKLHLCGIKNAPADNARMELLCEGLSCGHAEDMHQEGRADELTVVGLGEIRRLGVIVDIRTDLSGNRKRVHEDRAGLEQ